MNKVLDEEVIKAKESVVGSFSKEDERVESFVINQSTEKPNLSENIDIFRCCRSYAK